MKTTNDSTPDLSKGPVLALTSLLLALCLFISALPASAQSCPAGVSSVTVEFLTTISDSKERREHALISTALANALGIDARIDPAEDINPQIRVVVDSPANSTAGAVSTANFTVAGTFTDTDRRLQVYRQEDDEDEDSGQWKLVGDYADPPADSDLSVTVHAFPASTSTTFEGGSTTTHTGLCEPALNADNGEFTETAEIRTAVKDLVILAPHGGGVEEGTSEMADTILTTLGSRARDGDLWKSEGTWDLSDASERWHITSGALQEASWPALQDILDEPDHQTGRPYRYAVSLHGFGWSGDDRYGVVIGGQSSDFEKCYIVRRARQAFAAVAQPGGSTIDRSHEVAFYVFGADGDDHSFPNRKGQRIEGERSIRGLRGLGDDNIVNRMSPNEVGDTGHGGIQIEVSNDLRREDDLRDALAAAVGEALADILDGTADPFINAGCAAMVDSYAPVTTDVGLLAGGENSRTRRREEARISDTLAAELGITAEDLDPAQNGGVQPQIRVVVTSPARTDGDLNEAVFSVVGSFVLATRRVDVHPMAFADDDDSGEYKLLADLAAGSVAAAVYAVAPSSSSLDLLEDDGDADGSFSASSYRPPNADPSISFTEGGRLVEDRRAIVMAPSTDLGSSSPVDLLLEQTVAITDRMETGGVWASRWHTVGRWPTGDAFAAWQVDNRRYHPRSFPALGELMDGEYEETGEAFGYALSLSGYGRSDNEVIVGGLGDRTEKCYLVDRMRQALTTAGRGDEIAFYVVDDAGDLSLPNLFGHWIDWWQAASHAGQSSSLIYNRIAVSSFLISESHPVRADVGLRNAVAEGLGDALVQLVDGGGVPAGFSCNSL